MTKLAYELRRVFLAIGGNRKAVGIPKLSAIMEGGKMVPATNDSVLNTL